MKSFPFMMNVKVPSDISEGQVHEDTHGIPFKITKIKSIKFLDMRTMQVMGLANHAEVKSNG